MKIIILLCLCATMSWACSDLALLQACNMPGGDCTCQAGLACRLTKKLIYQGDVIPVKQCMPVDLDIEVEVVDIENGAQGRKEIDVGRTKRFLFNKCSTEAECSHNFCCAFGKRCAPKLDEYFTCFFTDKHKCGCREEFECKVTTKIALPIVGTKLPIKQCVKPETPTAF